MRQNRKLQVVLLFACVMFISSILFPIALSLQSNNSIIDGESVKHPKIAGNLKFIQFYVSFEGGIEENGIKKSQYNTYFRGEETHASTEGKLEIKRYIYWKNKYRTSYHLIFQIHNNGDIEVEAIVRVDVRNSQGNYMYLTHLVKYFIAKPSSTQWYSKHYSLLYPPSNSGDYIQGRIYCKNNDAPKLSVEIKKPVELTTISGEFTIHAKFNRVVDKRYLYIDNNYVESRFIDSNEYFYTWDTTKVSNGWHWIEVVGWDAYGNRCSKKIQVNVDNRDAIEIVDDTIEYIKEKVSDKKTKDHLVRKVNELKKELVKPTVNTGKVREKIDKVEKETQKAYDKGKMPNFVKNNIFRELQKIRDRIL